MDYAHHQLLHPPACAVLRFVVWHFVVAQHRRRNQHSGIWRHRSGVVHGEIVASLEEGLVSSTTGKSEGIGGSIHLTESALGLSEASLLSRAHSSTSSKSALP